MRTNNNRQGLLNSTLGDNTPRIKIPISGGPKLTAWGQWCNIYFHVYETWREQKVELATLLLEEKLGSCYQEWQAQQETT